MATLTLIQQSHVQGIYELSDGTFTIGSDADNVISIAANDVAPLHAVVYVAGGRSLLRQADGQFPVTLNGEAVREHTLKDGDRIGVGSQMLFYVEDAVAKVQGSKGGAAPEVPLKMRDALEPIPFAGHLPVQEGEASLQFLSGGNIGRVLPLRNAMTQLGKAGQDGAALLARRADGYYLTAIDREDGVKVNEKAIGSTTVKLKPGDLLEVGKQTLQFFWEA